MMKIHDFPRRHMSTSSGKMSFSLFSTKHAVLIGALRMLMRLSCLLSICYRVWLQNMKKNTG